MRAVPRPRAPRADSETHRYLEALRSGDEPVVAEMVTTLHPYLLRCALRVVRDTDVAADVVQDTWVVVLSSHERFEQRSALRTWIAGTTLNLARRRRDRDRRAHPGGLSLDLAHAEPHVAGPEELAVERAAGELVRRALAELPARQRQVVHLRDVVGLGSQDVCARLDLSPGSQRVLLHRGRARLQAALVEAGAESWRDDPPVGETTAHSATPGPGVTRVLPPRARAAG